MKTLTSTGLAAILKIGSFGDGRDGSQTFDGSATVLGMVPISNVYTMTRNIYCTSITITGGRTVKTNGFKIFCTGTLSNSGSILCEGLAGTAGSTSTGGAGATGIAATTEFMASASGGAGATSSAGATGGSSLYTMRTATGAAGAGGAGGGTPAQGTGPGGSDAIHMFFPIFPANGPKGYDAGADGIRFKPRFDPFCMPSGQAIGGGAGGGGGGRGQGPGGGGGGGGAGGGCLAVFASTLTANTGSVVGVSGGSGGVGGTGGSGYGGGGGGGGSGGYLLLYYNSASFASNTTRFAGGAGGTNGTGSSGNGVAGTSGASGVILKYNAANGIWE